MPRRHISTRWPTRHGYYACVNYVDAQVGKLLAALRRWELDQNTIVVLWGDHGYALGESQRWCKGTNFELDTHVPLIIRMPGMAQPGTASEALAELVDVYPTLAELAGLSPPADLDGRSLVAILNDPTTTGRSVVLSQFARPFKPTEPEMMGYSIRTDSHRYTRWISWNTRQVIAEELYDYTEPASTIVKHSTRLIEHRNVVDDASRGALKEQLRTSMDKTLATRRRTVAAAQPRISPN